MSVRWVGGGKLVTERQNEKLRAVRKWHSAAFAGCPDRIRCKPPATAATQIRAKELRLRPGAANNAMFPLLRSLTAAQFMERCHVFYTASAQAGFSCRFAVQI